MIWQLIVNAVAMFKIKPALALAIGFACFCASRAAFLFMSHEPKPCSEIAVPNVDLGTVSLGQAFNRDFVVHNAGDARLLITNIECSCECTTAELSRRVVASGESIPLHVTFTARSPGLGTQSVKIQTNDPSHPTCILKLRAYVVP